MEYNPGRNPEQNGKAFLLLVTTVPIKKDLDWWRKRAIVLARDMDRQHPLNIQRRLN